MTFRRHREASFYKRQQFSSYLRITSYFMVPGVSFPHSQGSTADPYPEPGASTLPSSMLLLSCPLYSYSLSYAHVLQENSFFNKDIQIPSKHNRIYYTLPLLDYMFLLLRVIIRPSSELIQNCLIPSALWDPVALRDPRVH